MHNLQSGEQGEAAHSQAGEVLRGRYLVVVSRHACNGCDQGIRLGRADVHHHDNGQ